LPHFNPSDPIAEWVTWAARRDRAEPPSCLMRD
jgi:hypothetical protein